MPLISKVVIYNNGPFVIELLASCLFQNFYEFVFDDLFPWSNIRARVIMCSAYLLGVKNNPSEDLTGLAENARRHNALCILVG